MPSPLMFQLSLPKLGKAPFHLVMTICHDFLFIFRNMPEMATILITFFKQSFIMYVIHIFMGKFLLKSKIHKSKYPKIKCHSFSRLHKFPIPEVMKLSANMHQMYVNIELNSSHNLPQFPIFGYETHTINY